MLSSVLVLGVLAGLASVVPVPAVGAPAPAPVALAADPGAVWSPVAQPVQARHEGLRRRVAPSSYAAYHLDLAGLVGRLDRAPQEGASARASGALTIEVPAPTGELVEFAIVESPVMEYPVRGATSLALVLSNGRDLGSVDVFLGRTRLATISGRGAPRTQRIAAIKRFASPATGTLRIVTRSKAPVRVDGLALRTSAATPRPVGRPGESTAP
ncbi:hypothetical protein [Nocardioides rubriscoriae]|uniref:hypothetical protein n=1 Tax=Nocardioides rubriscoriae TaxID=642762 RepID=UPI0011E00B50|nr:hypothetical protein [Nocardioides rubriscoriae]